jgi:OmpA-OmpF porin, OOP family
MRKETIMAHPIRRKQAVLAVLLALAALAASAQPGYLTTTRSTIVTSSTGLCVHTGSWTPAHAVPQCDAVPRAEAPAPRAEAPAPRAEAPRAMPPPVAAAPQPKAFAPQPQVVPHAAPVIRRLTLSTELLFPFDSATLRSSGRAKLEDLAQELEGARIERVTAVGHADRIGSEAYNIDLSQQRAESVQHYLGELGLDPKRVQPVGRGEAEPITDGQCKGLQDEALIACLQPDRRVELEVRASSR